MPFSNRIVRWVSGVQAHQDPDLLAVALALRVAHQIDPADHKAAGFIETKGWLVGGLVFQSDASNPEGSSERTSPVDQHALDPRTPAVFDHPEVFDPQGAVPAEVADQKEPHEAIVKVGPETVALPEDTVEPQALDILSPELLQGVYDDLHGTRPFFSDPLSVLPFLP